MRARAGDSRFGSGGFGFGAPGPSLFWALRWLRAYGGRVSPGRCPGSCAVVPRRVGSPLAPRPRLSLLPLAPVVHSPRFRACAVVAWVELRSFWICVLGRVAAFLRRLTPFRPSGLHVCSACLHGSLRTGLPYSE